MDPARFVRPALRDASQSDIRRMTALCQARGGINLGQGVCDLPTPEPVRRGAIEAIEAGRSLYAPMHGVPELRAALAGKFERHNGLRYDPDTEIVVTAGSSGALDCVLAALLQPGDGVLLFEPYYGYHREAARLAGMRLVWSTLTPPDFAISEDAIRAAVDDGTRAVIVCTPNNPCGKVWTEDELRALARVAQERDLLVITDEVYEYLVYDGRRHVSPASLPELRDRTVTITSLSKTFAITGWRLGAAAAPAPMARALMLANDLHVVCAPTPLQWGAVAGLAQPDAWFAALGPSFQARRERICAALDRAGLPPIVPEGAYYVLADCRGLEQPTGRAAAELLLDRTGVAAVSGACFYDGAVGQGLLRFCFAKEDAALDEACRRLERLA